MLKFSRHAFAREAEQREHRLCSEGLSPCLCLLALSGLSLPDTPAGSIFTEAEMNENRANEKAAFAEAKKVEKQKLSHLQREMADRFSKRSAPGNCCEAPPGNWTCHARVSPWGGTGC